MSVYTFTKENFNSEVLSSEQPVLVDFWAPWCTPCRMFSPVVDQVAEEQAGKVKVGKVNIDDEPELAAKYGVMSIPTLLLVKNGEVAAQSVGVKPKRAVEEMLE